MTEYQVVYKYRVNVGSEIQVPWGAGSRVTGAVADADGVTFWCVHINPDSLTMKREVGIVGTGSYFAPWLEVLATSRDEQSGLVWHLLGAVVK